MPRHQLECARAASDRSANEPVAKRGWKMSRRGALFALAGVAALLSGLVAAPAPAQQGADTGDWIGTWTASPQPVWDADFFAPVGIPRALRNQTLRQIARVSLGGSRVRVVISNEYGSSPLVIGAAHVALADNGVTIVPGSDRALTFSGQPSATIPPGAPMISDPVDLTVAPLGSVAVSLFLPEITPTTTWHNEGVQTAYISGEGNFASDVEFEPAADDPVPDLPERDHGRRRARRPGDRDVRRIRSPMARPPPRMPTTVGPTSWPSGSMRQARASRS